MHFRPFVSTTPLSPSFVCNSAGSSELQIIASARHARPRFGLVCLNNYKNTWVGDTNFVLLGLLVRLLYLSLLLTLPMQISLFVLLDLLQTQETELSLLDLVFNVEDLLGKP